MFTYQFDRFVSGLRHIVTFTVVLYVFIAHMYRHIVTIGLGIVKFIVMQIREKKTSSPWKMPLNQA